MHLVLKVFYFALLGSVVASASYFGVTVYRKRASRPSRSLAIAASARYPADLDMSVTTSDSSHYVAPSDPEDMPLVGTSKDEGKIGERNGFSSGP